MRYNRKTLTPTSFLYYTIVKGWDENHFGPIYFFYKFLIANTEATDKVRVSTPHLHIYWQKAQRFLKNVKRPPKKGAHKKDENLINYLCIILKCFLV